jgi:phosphoglycolate phosphatase
MRAIEPGPLFHYINLMPTELLIFDLDGTLVDSSVDISNALNYAIQPFGIEPVSLAETLTLIGEGVTRLIGKLIERREADLDLPILLDRFFDHYTVHFADHTAPYPGVEEVLQALCDRKKAIVSNKRESLSLRMIEAMGLRRYFNYVAGGDTFSEKKPSPLPIIDVLSRFGVPPENALLIGDSIYDVEAGRAARVRTIAALYGYGSPGFSRRADYEITTIYELPEVVRQSDGR